MSSEKRRYEMKERAARQAETRRRIVEATVALHQEIGPANTTVTEIARRAGVQRLTVYNHFPDEAELFAACQRRFLAEHPLPDLAPALAVQDPHARTKAVLEALYASYRERDSMTAKVLRDRSLVPALDRLLAQTLDAQMSQLAGALAAQGDRRRQAAVALALDFGTWQRLTRSGMDDREAAELMAALVACAD
jgi:AcrR family transcriptional regulator